MKTELIRVVGITLAFGAVLYLSHTFEREPHANPDLGHQNAEIKTLSLTNVPISR